METSILTSTKKILGIAEDYTAFDLDIITHINTTFTSLTQMGIGPAGGFAIEDADVNWEDFIGTDDFELESVKSYVYLRIRLIFDPPATSFVINALEDQLREIAWRLNAHREDLEWAPGDPDVPTVVEGGEL